MLRRRLLSRVGFLICAFVVGAIVAVWMLQDVLADIDAANNDAVVLIDGVQEASSTAIAIERAAASGGPPAEVQATIDSLARDLQRSIDRLAAHEAVKNPATPAGAAFVHARDLVRSFVASPPNASQTAGLHAALQDLGRQLRAHVALEQVQVGRYFRGLVLGLTVAAMIIMNVAILILLHTAQMVLRPVAQLVEGSRLLAAEQFDHRVNVDQQDEFGELAHAYNHLASQLQSSEDRKAETLRQLAVTLNHGLNNAMSIIEMQLGLLDRQAGGNPALASHLREIRACLARMSGIVASLKQIRRVVLTDYLPGQKMIDLERSVGSEPAAPAGQSP